MRKFTASKIEECAAWVREHGLSDCGGATVRQFCKSMDIGKTTYCKWMGITAFSDAINEARAVFRASLERDVAITMKKAATGYETEETKTEYRPGTDGQPVPARMTKTTRHVAPNVAACIFLLTNIAPDKWQNKRRAEFCVRRDDVDAMTRDEIERELKRLRALDALDDGGGCDQRDQRDRV